MDGPLASALVSLIKYREAEVILARPSSAGDDDRPTSNLPHLECAKDGTSLHCRGITFRTFAPCCIVE